MSPGIMNRCILLLQATIIFFQCLCIDGAREIHDQHNHGHHQMSSSSSSYRMDLAAHVFFHEQDLKAGNKILVYFSIKDISKRPPLLSREEADSIPFSSSKLPYLLRYFSLSENTPQSEAMKSTLSHCEMDPMKAETKLCATSLESMLDSARSLFGPNHQMRVLTTNTNQTASILQNYTIIGQPTVIRAPMMLACHTLPYPYAVYYCHSQKSDNNLFKLRLAGENGERVDAVAICHMDSSEWDPNHVAFRVLKTVPGESPVCHFFPADNLVWVASASSYN